MFKISIFEGDTSLIKQAGFDSVMLGWRDDDRKEKPDRFRKAGLHIENIHAATKNSDDFWLDNLNGEDYMNCLLTSINDCKEYNIPTMAVHLIYGSVPPPPDTIGIERLKRITEKAEHDNINIAFENTGSAECVRFVFDNIPSKKLGFCFDSGHQNLSAPDDLLEEYGDRLMAMHLNDNFGTDDLHLLPFDGNIDWNKITRQLKNVKYKGAIAFEINNSNYAQWSPEKFYEEAFNRATKLWDMVNK